LKLVGPASSHANGFPPSEDSFTIRSAPRQRPRSQGRPPGRAALLAGFRGRRIITGFFPAVQRPRAAARRASGKNCEGKKPFSGRPRKKNRFQGWTAVDVPRWAGLPSIVADRKKFFGQGRQVRGGGLWPQGPPSFPVRLGVIEGSPLSGKCNLSNPGWGGPI